MNTRRYSGSSWSCDTSLSLVGTCDFYRQTLLQFCCSRGLHKGSDRRCNALFTVGDHERWRLAPVSEGAAPGACQRYSHAFIDNRHTTSSFHTYNNAFQVVVFRHDLGAVVQGNSRFATNAWYEGYSSRENASIGCLATSLIGTSRSRANRCFL